MGMVRLQVVGPTSVLTSGSVGMGIPMLIPMGISVGMGWVWGLKCYPHGSPAIRPTALCDNLERL